MNIINNMDKLCVHFKAIVYKPQTILRQSYSSCLHFRTYHKMDKIKTALKDLSVCYLFCYTAINLDVFTFTMLWKFTN